MGKVTGVFVDRIEVDPANDADNRIDGFIREFDMGPIPGDELTTGQVEDLIESFMGNMRQTFSMSTDVQTGADAISFIGSGYKITYELIVRAPASAIAKAKSRMYVRYKNPFEFDSIRFELVEPWELSEGPLSAYRIRASIDKN